MNAGAMMKATMVSAPPRGTPAATTAAAAAPAATEHPDFATQLQNVKAEDGEERALSEEKDENAAGEDENRDATATVEVDARAIALAIVIGERADLTLPPNLGGNAMVATEAGSASSGAEGSLVDIAARSPAPPGRSTDMSTGSEETLVTAPPDLSVRSPAPAGRSPDMSTGPETTAVSPTPTPESDAAKVLAKAAPSVEQASSEPERSPQAAAPTLGAPSLPFAAHLDTQSVQAPNVAVDALDRAHARATSPDTTPVSLLTVRHATHAEIHDAELGTIRVDAETKHGKVELAVKTTQIETAIALQAIEPVLRADFEKDAVPFGSYRVDVDTSGHANGQPSSHFGGDARQHAFSRGESQGTQSEGEAPTSDARPLRGGRVRIVL